MSLIYSYKAGNYSIPLEWLLSRVIKLKMYSFWTFTLYSSTSILHSSTFASLGHLGEEREERELWGSPGRHSGLSALIMVPRGQFYCFPSDHFWELCSIPLTGKTPVSRQRGRKYNRAQGWCRTAFHPFRSLEFIMPFSGPFYEKADRELK